MEMNPHHWQGQAIAYPGQTSSVTFAEAALSYQAEGKGERYLEAILPHIGHRPLVSIFPAHVRKLAETIYPDQSNATRNRCVLTPVRAVINHAYDEGWCNRIYIKRFKEDAPAKKEPPTVLWMHVFLRQCEINRLPHLAALVLFMSQTAARVSEAIDLRWSEVSLPERRVLLLKTKTERNSYRYLTDELMNRFQMLSVGRSPDERVFKFTNRGSVNERLKAVCRRAGIKYKPSHLCGRHFYATSAIDMGIDVKTAMDGGGWKSSAIFLNIYVHPRQNPGRVVADRFNRQQFDIAV